MKLDVSRSTLDITVRSLLSETRSSGLRGSLSYVPSSSLQAILLLHTVLLYEFIIRYTAAGKTGAGYMSSVCTQAVHYHSGRNSASMK
jgi:hypothetical protein